MVGYRIWQQVYRMLDVNNKAAFYVYWAPDRQFERDHTLSRAAAEEALMNEGYRGFLGERCRDLTPRSLLHTIIHLV